MSSNSSKHFVLSAIGIHEGQIFNVRSSIDKIVSDFFPPGQTSIEIHASALANGKGAFSPLFRSDRESLLKELLSSITIKSHRAVLMSSVVVKENWPREERDDIKLKAFEQIIDKVNFFLKRKHRSNEPQKGMLIVDHSSSELLERFRLYLERVQAFGSKYQLIDHVIDTVYSIESKSSRLVQIADLASWAVFRKFEFEDPSYWEILKGVFDRDEKGKRAGISIYRHPSIDQRKAE